MYKVILIDDEKFVLTSLEGRINWKSCGFEIVGKAHSAMEGYELMKALEPDVVFTDIKMPGMNGIELIRIASGEFTGTKFVVISGHAEFEYAKKAIEYGVIGFCTKPFDEDEIYSVLLKVKNMLGKEDSKEPENIMKYIGINTEESVAKKKELLRESSVMAYNSKVIVVVPKDSEVEFCKEFSMLKFSIDKRCDGYIIASDIQENIILNIGSIKNVGLSSLFFDDAYIDTALEEAKTSAYQYFINGNKMNIYNFEKTSTDMIEQLKNLRKCYELREVDEVTKGFCRLLELFITDKLTIKEAYRVYNSILTIMDEQLTEYCEDYWELTNRFNNVTDMISTLEDVMSSHILQSTDEHEKSKPMKEITMYINKHYYDCGLTVQKVSTMFGFNSNYISQLFKKAKAENFTTYLTKVRMEHAKELLKKSEYPINFVGEKVGYPDYFYFAKVFKKYVGETPSQYRKDRKEE